MEILLVRDAPRQTGASRVRLANAVPPAIASSLSRSLSGHLRTVGWRAVRGLRPEPSPVSEPWSAVVEDPKIGPVRLSGRLRRAAPARVGAPAAGGGLLVVVHGLGASAEAGYALRAARAAEAAGLACLRLNLRGADRSGEDYYHAGLTEDLRAALASPALAGFERVAVLGFSLGGHLALRYATQEPDPRLRAVAAICAPLDLAAGGRLIDRPGLWAYRRYLFGHLLEIYAAVARRRPVPLPLEAARKIRTFLDWDTRVVAARHGFRDAADYYARMSVGPLLECLAVPALLVSAEDDPMVPPGAVLPVLAGRDTPLEVRWVRSGGHMAFAPGLDLGFGGARGVEAQVVAWLGRSLAPGGRRGLPSDRR
jgi:predicted alpha/beta-fold hydrolase